MQFHALIRHANTDVRLELRRQMLLLREQGRTHGKMATITGYTRSYVSTMLKRLERAPELLEGMSRGGRPVGSLRALSAKEERRAQQLICGKCPDQLSMPFALWTRVAIRELIRKEFGIRLSIRGVGEYLARWGYTPQKAARLVTFALRKLKRLPELVRSFFRAPDTRYAAA